MTSSIKLKVPVVDDLHCHLRQGELMQAVVPTLRQGGAGVVLVMVGFLPLGLLYYYYYFSLLLL
jgi:dihydroorotase